MIWWIANVLIAASVVLESGSYIKQIQKTRLEKDSSDISSTSYLYKLAKYICAIGALIIYHNWAGLVLEIFSLILCIITFYYIVKYKPKNWELF